MTPLPTPWRLSGNVLERWTNKREGKGSSIPGGGGWGRSGGLIPGSLWPKLLDIVFACQSNINTGRNLDFT